jgi:CheY-like chemotaxis protein
MPGPVTILVVDDDESSRASVALILEVAGFHVVRAGHGEEALELIEAGLLPVLMVLDLHMPVMNGRELMHALRARYSELPFPVLVVSGLDAALPGEAVAFLRKPLDANHLIAKVRLYATGAYRTGFG